MPTTVHAPLQVMLQVPPAHTTFDPAPTVCVQLVPAHVTLQAGPQVPVHAAPLWQSNRQPEVVALQVSNAQVKPDAQLHAVPEQFGGAQDAPAMTSAARNENRTSTGFIIQPPEAGNLPPPAEAMSVVRARK